MGIELKVRVAVGCRETHCVAKSVVESILSKLGITVGDVEEYVKELAELTYGATFTVDNVVITIRDVYYDWNTDDCDYRDDCVGATTVKFEVDGDASKMKQIVMKILKDIGADKYVKICE
jgi:hypothetical protein